MKRNQPPKSWKPSVPNPEIFQVQKPHSKALAIKPPAQQGSSLAKPVSTEDIHGTTTSDPSTDIEHSDVTDSTILSKRQPRADHVVLPLIKDVKGASAETNTRPLLPTAPVEEIKGSLPERVPHHADDSNEVAIEQQLPKVPAPTNGLSPVPEPNDVPPTKHQQTVPAWKPDVFVHAFVPQSFLAVNNAPATPIISQAVDSINFPRYVSTFASPLFLPPMFSPTQSLTISRLGLLRSENLTPQNYFRHFIDCVMLNLEAQTPEIRSYDLFGVQLEIVDFDHRTFSLRVPGLREGAPRASFGDIVMLRQLIFDLTTNLPLGMEYWEKSGARERGVPAPGFTGFEITGTVVAVIKQYEILHLRLAGVLAMPLIFNVSFVVQGRSVYCLQRTIADIAHELTSNLDREVSREQDSPTYLTQSSDASRTLQFDVKQPDGSTGAMPLTTKRMPREWVDNRNWLHRMLFPSIADGVLQTALPQGTFRQSWYDKDLNYEQMKAVAAVQSMNYGNICFLIHGPPGTGKTKTVVETVAQLANDDAFSGSILLCAPSDPAADTLALRLSVYFNPQTMFRLNEFSRTFAEVPQELLTYCYVEDNIFSLPPLPRLMSFKIVITTCRGADVLINARVTNRDLVSLQKNMLGILHSSSESHKSTPLHWAALLIDEAAQATEPEILVPLAVVTPHAGRTCHPSPVFVMAGDQYQLGPRTYDRTTALHVSLFERLSNRPIYASHPRARRPANRQSPHLPVLRPPFVNLVRNYRSHPAILAVPSSLFYNNSLIPEASNVESLSAWSGWCGRRWPVLFACNSGIDHCEDVRTVGGGWYNMREAQKAINYAEDLLKLFGGALLQSEICIMSPFRAQVHLLRKIARVSGLWDLNIGPMDAFQGLESRVVIICTTRTRSRFLEVDALRGIGVINEPKKLNVALTRAKEGLIVLGNPWVLSQDQYWDAFLRFCWRNELWSNDEAGQDPRMPEGEEANANSWEPLAQGKTIDEVSGLEAALLYQEREPVSTMEATRRFLSTSQDDEMWISGIQAMQELSVRDEHQGSIHLEYDKESKPIKRG